MTTSAKVIADSTFGGHRLTTLEVTLHRFVLAELNTHRVFSRNSASSRAIPLRKQLERVRDDPAVPVRWPAEQSGMQGGDDLGEKTAIIARRLWLRAREVAYDHAEELGKLGVHKSICNRLLEPFLWHTVIITSTEWDNFWYQRCSPLAQPEIRAAADVMRAAYDASTPDVFESHWWHLPYLDGETIEDVTSYEPDATRVLCQVSAARCARVSYLTQSGQRDYREDLKLYERLVTADPPHASPLEHVATPCPGTHDHLLLPRQLHGLAPATTRGAWILMRTITVSVNSGSFAAEVSDEFAAVIEWLVKERVLYQGGKWDYSTIDLEHALQGLADDSWFYERGILNYTGRVRLFGVTSPLGLQALLKLVATLASMPEHLLRGGVIDTLPTPGLSSGNLE